MKNYVIHHNLNFHFRSFYFSKCFHKKFHININSIKYFFSSRILFYFFYAQQHIKYIKPEYNHMILISAITLSLLKNYLTAHNHRKL